MSKERNKYSKEPRSLSETFPEVASQWHPIKNGQLKPSDIQAGAGKKVWWLCPEGPDHEWEQTPNGRIVGGKIRGCPFCGNTKLSTTNSLATLNPELASQWHPTKNGELKPENIMPNSSTKVWWLCPEGSDHEWETQLSQRSKAKTGCPFCSKQKVSITNSLATVFPEIAAQWHSTKNGELKPKDVVSGGDKKIWWKCPEGDDHEWEVKIQSRIKAGCPFCSNRRLSVTNSLATLFPEIAAQWHSTENGELKPTDIIAGTNKKVWWECPAGPDHEWEAAPNSRISKGTGCPFCPGNRVSVTNSLATQFPDIAALWHPHLNKEKTPDQISARGIFLAWWKCPEGDDHEWKKVVNHQTGGGANCPFCANQKLSVTNSLFTVEPELSSQWHPTKNGDLTPEKVIATTTKNVWWLCPEGPEHEWQTSARNRTGINQSGCPFCSNLKVSSTNSLAARNPEIAKFWDFEQNGDLKPTDVVSGSDKKVWWTCPEGPDHKWESAVGHRIVRGKIRGCPFCANQKLSNTNSLATINPIAASQWHPTKNGDLKPTDIIAGNDGKKIWWKCPDGPDHEWQATAYSRYNSSQTSSKGCPFCSGNRLSTTNSLEVNFPEVAKEWHPIKNGQLKPSDIQPGAGKKVWWLCPEGTDHEWQASVAHRANGTGCPYCNQGWTVAKIRLFVKSLLPNLSTLSPADLYLLFQQAGIAPVNNRAAKDFVKALSTGHFPHDELEKFVDEKPSLVDKFLNDEIDTLEELKEEEDLLEVIGAPPEQAVEVGKKLPEIKTEDILKDLDSEIFSSSDEEAIEYLISSGVGKLWEKIYRDESQLEIIFSEAEAFEGTAIGARVRDRFIREVEEAQNLVLPDGYSFRPGNAQEIAPPNLMQRHVATLVRDRKRVGNWSGTGAGKTLSAILASRISDAKLTVICCPNAVVEIVWKEELEGIFPDSQVCTKTWNPIWDENVRHHYLVLNYEMFQLAESGNRLAKYLAQETPDFIIIDEIHFSKQSSPKKMSNRRAQISTLISNVGKKNPDLRILGMSATPVINNLQEGRSLIELITGKEFVDLKTVATVSNAMRIHQQFVRLGVRWIPNYDIDLELEMPEIDCSDFIEEIRKLPKGAMLPLEQILTKARLPEIRRRIKPKTLIYTMYISEIDKTLRDALTEDGWNVGFYTGEDKSGLNGFLNGDIDVLIATSAIATGVNGLQYVCNQLIVNVLPWTAAEFEQLKGRIFRQGQAAEKVKVVVPITGAEITGERWSWCQTKWDRVEFKKSLADSAVDGVVPEGHLRSPAQAYKDAMEWLERLNNKGLETIPRPIIDIPLPEPEDQGYIKRVRKYGDFSRMNANWNGAKSLTTHERLQENPEEWETYHSLYREARSDWTVVPFEEMANWLKNRKDYVVGDFGCGEALLAERLQGICTVKSFDHIAVNDDVIACDMSNVPVEDEELDVAVFSLSLMGSNFTDYLKEAHRTLKLDGSLHIYESTSRFTNREQFISDLKKLGFGQVTFEDSWKFTHIRATKDRLSTPTEVQKIRGL